VEDGLDGRVGQQPAQRIQILDAQRIDDEVGLAGGELDQADLLLVGVQAVGFGIYGQQRLAGPAIHMGDQAGRAGNDGGRGKFVHNRFLRLNTAGIASMMNSIISRISMKA